MPFRFHTPTLQRLWQIPLSAALLIASACHLPAPSSPHQVRLPQAGGARISVNLQLSGSGFRTQTSQSGYAATVAGELEALRVFLVDSASPPTGVISPVAGSLTTLTTPLSSPNLIFEHVPAGNIWACAAAFVDDLSFNASTNRTAETGVSYAEGPCICSNTGGQGSGSVTIDANFQLPGGGPYPPLAVPLQLRAAKGATLASEVALNDGLNLGMTFNYIPAGSFSMGDLLISDATPPRFTTLTQGFYLQTTEVTQEQWLAVMGSFPGTSPNIPTTTNGLGDRYPMYFVSWNDVQDFLSELNSRSTDTYRLPTEAEWEYAARAGTTTPFSCDAQAGNCPDDYAWYNATIPASPNNHAQQVASKLPNPWGLYDMHGNVAEWVSDWYGALYDLLEDTDPTGPTSGTEKVYRGGIATNGSNFTRSAHRSFNPSLGVPSNRISFIGFRLVREP